MDWVYLSPHLDDVALSCGGLVWEQTQAGQTVSVVTICAGDPPPGPLTPFARSLHERWNMDREAVARRRQEDLVSCGLLGASAQHFAVPDCIYRRSEIDGGALYDSEESLSGPLNPVESGLIHRLSKELSKKLPRGVEVVCPLTLGGHVDHILTRLAAEKSGRSLWYYADYPYLQQDSIMFSQLNLEGCKPTVFPVSKRGLNAWEEAVAAHASQISTFWRDIESMRGEIREYHQEERGVRLWRCD